MTKIVKYDYIPIFNDNYVWCIHNGVGAAVVDPGDAKPVIEYLNKHNLQLSTILITHHHQDHIGGVEALVNKYNSKVYSNIDNIATDLVRAGDIVTLSDLCLEFSVIEIPGHTLDHIAFYGNGWLFSGDTLFSAGCGRVFEGTHEMMYHSLSKIANLDENTLIFPTHEYTLSNLKFACTVEPNNIVLQNRYQECLSLRENNQATLPVVLVDEKQTNPFLRCDVAELKSSLNMLDQSSVEVFKFIRQWKDTF